MGVGVIQLKPLQESFYVIVFEKLAPLSAVVLCEGHSDAEVAKRILQKMESEGVIGRISLKIGFTDVGGKDNVPKMLDAILSLTRSSRDPLPASLGGFTPPPSGLSVFPLGRALLIFLSDPHAWGITFQLAGARLPRG